MKKLKKLGALFLITDKLKNDTSKIKQKKIATKHFEATRSPLLRSKIISGEQKDIDVTPANRRTLDRMYDDEVDKIFKENLIPRLGNAYDRAQYRSEKNLVVGNVLMKGGMRDAAREMMIYSFRSGRIHEHTAVSMSLCAWLRYDVALTGHIGTFNKYCKDENELMDRYCAETRAAQRANYIVIKMRHKYSYSRAMKKYIADAYRDTSKDVKLFPTHLMRYFHFRIGVRYYNMMRNPEGVLTLYSKLNKYYKKKTHLFQQSRLEEASLYALDVCIELRKKKRAGEIIKRLQHSVKPRTPYWYNFNEYYFIYLLHERKYEQALHVYEKVTSSTGYKKMQPEQTEKWKLQKSYLDLARSYAGEWQMRPQSFINKLRQLSSDKTGINFAVMVAELICLLMGNHDDRLIEFEERFKQYVKRYVIRKEHYRPYYFSKLVFLLFKYKYDVAKCKAIGNKYEKKLNDFSIRSARDAEMPEIIPYEHLWELIVSLLGEMADIQKQITKAMKRG